MIELFKTPDLNAIGSWSSIAGLLLTLLTFLLLFGIKKKFLFRSNVDDHIEKIIDISSQLSSLLMSFQTNQKAIEEQFALADVELRAMQRGADGDLLADIKKARKMIHRYTSILCFWVKKNENSAREVKKNLSVVSAELGHYKKSLLMGE